MKLTHFTITILLFCFLSGRSQESVLQAGLSYGTYQPGFKVIHTYDYSRSFSDLEIKETKASRSANFRPMQICVWYPSSKSGSEAFMTYEDYFLLKTSETGKREISKENINQLITDFVKEDGIDHSRLDDELGVQMKAIREALPASGKFPVIVYGPSWWSTAFENATMFEFLASHGYIVVSTPSMGPESREMPISRKGIECQARDMEFSLAEIVKMGLSDGSQIATMGFSLGGLSNVISAARNRNIKAWIGLDPSIHEAYELFDASPYTNYDEFNIPMLFVNSVGYMNSLPYYDRLFYSDAYLVNLPELHHTDLASMFIKLGMGPGGSNGSRLTVQNKGYRMMCQYVITFLKGVFEDKLEDEVILSQLQSISTDSNFVEIRHKKGLPMIQELFQIYVNQNTDELLAFLDKTSVGESGQYPENEIQYLTYLYTEAGLNKESAALMTWMLDNFPDSYYHRIMEFQNISRLTEMTHQVISMNGQCNFTYEELNHAGHVLSMGDKPVRGIPYFELNVKLRPENFKAAFNMGVGYSRISDKERAKEFFQKCLTLKPDQRYRDLANSFLKDMSNLSSK